MLCVDSSRLCMSGLSLCDLCLCYSILGSQFSKKYLLTYLLTYFRQSTANFEGRNLEAVYDSLPERGMTGACCDRRASWVARAADLHVERLRAAYSSDRCRSWAVLPRRQHPGTASLQPRDQGAPQNRTTARQCPLVTNIDSTTSNGAIGSGNDDNDDDNDNNIII